MLISNQINAAFNAQVGHELANSNQYVAVAAWFDGESLKGLAKMFYKQAEEERAHAMKFVKFILDAGGKVEIPAIPAVPNTLASAEAAAQLALESEERTTAQINDLMTRAIEEKNYAAQRFLGWFVEEQVEEIAWATTTLDIIQKAGSHVLAAEAWLIHHNQ